MIKIENTVTPSPEQWKAIIMGMRNPMNSWDRSDSEQKFESIHDLTGGYFEIGPNDQDLMIQLVKGGPVHAKYRRMITVYATITAPLYWWKEFDTYKVGTVANSCSTMHKIAAKEFTLEDFSCEHLMDNVAADIFQTKSPLDILYSTIDMLNLCRNEYLETKDKEYWWQMIQLLPSSYNQKRTVMLNYEVLAGIYPSRKNHKLDEWHVFCDWIVGLPYSEIIVGERIDDTGMTNTETGVVHEIPSFDIDKFPQDAEAVTLVPGMEVKDEANMRWVAACDLCNEHGCGDLDEETCKKCQFYQYSKWTKEENVGPNDGLNKHFGGYEE